MPAINPCFCIPLSLGILIFAAVDLGVNVLFAICLVWRIFNWKIFRNINIYNPDHEWTCDEWMDVMEEEKAKRDASPGPGPGIRARGFSYTPDGVKCTGSTGIKAPEGDLIGPGTNYTNYQLFAAAMFLALLVHLIISGLAVLLFLARQKKNPGLVMMWMIASIVLTALCFIIAILFWMTPWVTYSISEGGKTYEPISGAKAVPICELFVIFYKVYGIVLALFFIKELRNPQEMPGNAMMAPSQAQQSTANPEGSARSVHPSAHSTATGKNRP